MPKVKMLSTARGSPDGIRVETFEEGKTYTLLDALARAFVQELRVAEYAEEDAVLAKKQAPAAPENKDAGRAPENKQQQVTEAEANVAPYWDGKRGSTDEEARRGRGHPRRIIP